MGQFQLKETMDALATAMAEITGLRAYGWPNSGAKPPAVLVLYPVITYDTTYQRSSDDFTIEVVLVAGSVVAEATRNILDPFVSGDGAKSVKEALEDDPTLNGVIQTLRVSDVHLESIELNGVPYYGAVFTIEGVS